MHYILTSFQLLVFIVLDAVLTTADDGLGEASIYLKNAEFSKPYVCAMFVEITTDVVDLSRSSFVERWFVHSYSPQMKTHRHDYIPQSKTSFDEQTWARGEELRLFLLNDREVKQVSGGSIMQADMKDTSIKDPFTAITPMAYFEPMIIPFGGWSCLDFRRGIRTGVLEMMLRRYVVTDEIEKDYQVTKILRHGGSTFYDRIVFESRCGEMPVSVRRSDGKNGRPSECIVTTWGNIQEKWLPLVTEIKLSSIDDVTTWKVEYHWMLEDVPDDVFEVGVESVTGIKGLKGKVMRGRQLRDLAVSKSNKPRKPGEPE